MRVVQYAALIAAALLTGPVAAGVVEEFKAEDWNGMAFADDQSGKLANCSVYAQYENGVTLYFFNNADGSWTLGLSNDDWTLKQDDPHEVRYRVDRRRTTDATAVALDDNLLGVSLQADDPLLAQVRRGNELIVTFDGTDYSFELSNSDKALNAAQECVSRHLITVAETEDSPSGRESRPQAATGDSTEAAPSAQDAASGDTQGRETDAATSTESIPAASEPASESEASTVGERQEFGPWVVTATDDGAGNFVNCTAFGVHGDDQLILSHYPGDKWEFGLYRDGWALDTNQSYFLWYNVDAPTDGAGVIKRPVEAVEPTRIFFEVSSLEDIVARMEGGSTLNVQLRGFTGEAESYSYPLDGAAEAFAATRQCTLQHTDGAAADSGTPAEEPSASEPGDDVAVAGTLPPIGNETIEDLQVPGWQAGAYADAGTFTHCAIRAEYDNGTTLGVARTAGGALLLALHRSDWSLVAGAPLPATLMIGEGAPVASSGRALDETMLVIDLGDEDQVAADLADAKTLVVEVEGKTLEFDTSDIQPGIEAIDACREKHAAAVTDAEPDTAAEAKPAPEPDATAEAEPDAEPQPEAAAEAEAAPAEPPSPAALKAEAAGFTTALLIRSGYAGHVMLTGNNLPESMRDRHASWQIGEIMGITDIVSGTIDEIKAEVARTDSADCKGSLTTGVEVEDAAGHSHFFSTCDGADLDLAVHYVVVPRSDGGSYMLTFIGIGDGAAAEAIASKVYEIAAGA